VTAVINVRDLRGPFVDRAAEIVSTALRMSARDAARLVELWDDPAQDQAQYLRDCAVVWDALEASNRLLPLGWYERVFRDVQWMAGVPRALDAVADAVSVVLVRDLVPENVVETLLSPWRAFCAAAVV
jgi:hypothetical protein